VEREPTLVGSSDGVIPVMADDETASAEYASRFVGPVGRWMLAIQAEVLRSLVVPLIHPPPRALTMCDVGGGHGQVAEALFEHIPPPALTLTVTGSSARSARRLTPLTASGICTFTHANLLALPFPNGAFEITSCIRLASHTEHWRALIGELCRISAQRVIFEYPTWQSANVLNFLTFRFKRAVEKNTRTFTLFSHREVEREFAKHGFHRHKRHPQFLFPMALHRALKRPRLSQALERFGSRSSLTAWLGSPVIAAFDKISAQ